MKYWKMIFYLNLFLCASFAGQYDSDSVYLRDSFFGLNYYSLDNKSFISADKGRFITEYNDDFKNVFNIDTNAYNLLNRANKLHINRQKYALYPSLIFMASLIPLNILTKNKYEDASLIITDISFLFLATDIIMKFRANVIANNAVKLRNANIHYDLNSSERIAWSQAHPYKKRSYWWFWTLLGVGAIAGGTLIIPII